jgi:cytochrome c
MNSFELNKVLGAILGTCLIQLALNIGAGAIFSIEKPAKPGYAIAVKEGGGEKKEAAKKETPLPVLLASASVEKGQNATKACHACHTFEKGGPNRVGPNLYGIVGRPVASHAGFDYSDGLKKLGGDWSFEKLNKFIENPRADVPGTKMTFAGVNRDSQRADILAYLATLSDNPVPLPKPEAAAAPAKEGAAAENKPGNSKPAAAPEPAQPK